MAAYQKNSMNDAGTYRSALLDSSACYVCQDIGDLKNPRGVMMNGKYVYMHHPNIRTLHNSGEAGCCTCALLLLKLKDGNLGSVFNKVYATSSPACEISGEDPTSTTYVTQSQNDILATSQFEKIACRTEFNVPDTSGSRGHGHGRVFLRFNCGDKTGPRGSKGHNKADIFVFGTELRALLVYFNSIDDPIDPELQNRPSVEVLSDPHISLINRWRDTCHREHESCNKFSLNQKLPTRILELDPSNRQHPVRLLETHHMMQGSYVCLSYCWGDVKAQKGQTNQNNLPSQLHGIQFGNLPETVIDAIHICFKLGFRFLWVDRLCIVQDDEADWSMEASRMCDIYSRAALTIAVSLCDDSSQSFLSKRRMNSFREQSRSSVITYINEETGLKGGLWMTHRYSCNDYRGPWYLQESWNSFGAGSDLRYYVKGNQWMGRGWTFQEWMLSPRVLHIDTMTLWDCFNGYANELSHRYVDKPALLRDPMIMGKEASWDFMVQEYTRRDITFVKDRLPALAGLAARYRQVTGYTYLAGLWFEEMPKSLLWEPYYGRRSAHIPPGNKWHGKQTIPSWSWPYCDGPIRYEREVPWVGGFSAKASMASFHCRSHPPDSLSNLEEAWIDVKGHLSIVTEQEIEEDERSPGEEDLVDEESYPPLFVKAGNEWWQSFPDFGRRHQDDAIAQANIYILILGSRRTVCSGHQIYSGLVLIEWGFDDGHSCFRRLGTAELMRDGSDQSAPPGVGSPWQQRLIRLI